MRTRFEKSRGAIHCSVAILVAAGLFGCPAVYAQTRIADTPNSGSVSAESLPTPQGTAQDPSAAQPSAGGTEADESSSLLRPTTLDELETLALGNNPTLAQSRARIGAAEGQYIQGGLYPNPNVGYVAEEMGNSGHAGQQGLFVGQRIITAKKLQLNRETAAQGIEQAKWALQAQERRVLTDVRLAFYELLVARRTVQLQEQLLNIGRAGVKSAEALQAGKEVGRADLLQARVEVEAAAIQLENAQNRHTAACRRLAAVVGVPDVDVSQVQGSLEAELQQLSWEDSLSRLLRESPEVAQAQAGVERARWALQRECAGRVPNIDTLASVRYDASTQNTIAGVSIGMPLQLFDRNQGNIRRAQAELIDAEQDVQRLELQLRNRLAATFQRYDNARQQVERYSQNILPTAKESLDLIVSGYRQGEFPYLTLLTAQRTYFRVNLTYLDSLRDLRTSTIVIEGQMLSGGLGPEGGLNADAAADSGSPADAGLLRGISD